MSSAVPTSLDALFALHHSHGHRHYGEGVSADEHARQCAALATSDGATDELILAALFHDVGWFLHDDDHERDDEDGQPRDDNHAAWGARVLSPLFGPEVSQPVALHVMAKRWRCTIDPNYYDELSPASQISFLAQGGPLRTDERASFEAHPGFAAALALRSWDDRAKVPLMDVPDLESYRPLAEAVAHRFARLREATTAPVRSPDARERQEGESDARESESFAGSHGPSDETDEGARQGHQPR